MFPSSVGDGGVACECEEFAFLLVHGEADKCSLSLQGVDVDVDGGGVANDGGVVCIEDEASINDF